MRIVQPLICDSDGQISFLSAKLGAVEAASQKSPISYIIIRKKRARMFSLFNVQYKIIGCNSLDDDSLFPALQSCCLRTPRLTFKVVEK